MADFHFQVGQQVIFDGCLAIVQEVLDRGVGILRKSGPRAGIPIFVQPSALTIAEPPSEMESVVAVAVAAKKAKPAAEPIIEPIPEEIVEVAAVAMAGGQLSLLN